MSRNGSGTFTVINTFSPGQVISSADHNENFDDLGDEITNSVAVDGQSTMTGTLKLANGTVSLPALTFGSDTDCGLYRIGANNMGLAVNGAKVLDIATTGLGITGTLTVTGATTPSASDGAALGSSSLPWSDLFLASGSVINFNNGDVTITHAANGLTFAGGSSGYLFDAGVTVAAGGLTVSAGAVSFPANSIASSNLSTDLFATQAEQETATSVTDAVTPGRQQFHPSAVKAWAMVTGTTQNAVYNVSNVSSPGTGQYTVTFTTAMSSSTYCVVVTARHSATVTVSTISKSTGSFTITFIDQGGSANNVTGFEVIVMGDQ